MMSKNSLRKSVKSRQRVIGRRLAVLMKRSQVMFVLKNPVLSVNRIRVVYQQPWKTTRKILILAKMNHVLIPHQTPATKIKVMYRLTRKEGNLVLEEKQEVEVALLVHEDRGVLERGSIKQKRISNVQHSYPISMRTVSTQFFEEQCETHCSYFFVTVPIYFPPNSSLFYLYLNFQDVPYCSSEWSSEYPFYVTFLYKERTQNKNRRKQTNMY